MRKALNEKGGELLAVSADPPQRLADGQRDHPDLPCALGSDSSGDALRALGLLHPLTRGKFVAAPANILVKRGAEIAWTHYAEIVMDRPDPRDVLAEVQKII